MSIETSRPDDARRRPCPLCGRAFDVLGVEGRICAGCKWAWGRVIEWLARAGGETIEAL